MQKFDKFKILGNKDFLIQFLKLTIIILNM